MLCSWCGVSLVFFKLKIKKAINFRHQSSIRVFKNNTLVPICVNKPLKGFEGIPEAKEIPLEPSRQTPRHIGRLEGVRLEDSNNSINKLTNGTQLAKTSNTMSEGIIEGLQVNRVNEEETVMDLDLRSHQVISSPVKRSINNKSLETELQEADPEWALRHLTFSKPLMEKSQRSVDTRAIVHSLPIHTGLLQTASQDQEKNPDPNISLGSGEVVEMTDCQIDSKGKLDNSTEDALFLSFGDLPNQEQVEVIERLEHTRNRLLALKRTKCSNSSGEPSTQQECRAEIRKDLDPILNIQEEREEEGKEGEEEREIRFCLLDKAALRPAVPTNRTDGHQDLQDPPRCLQNGSVFLDKEEMLNQIDESN
ncbi:UNVERIFIED_CONTAM: hypothetical protein K2H54_003690 [Gekko kuhli]